MKKLIVSILLVLFSFTQVYGQSRESGIGFAGNPHAIVQLRYDEASRQNAINQIYDILENMKEDSGKRSIFERELQQIDITSALGIDTLKSDVASHLEGLLGFDLSKDDGVNNAELNQLLKEGETTAGIKGLKNKLGFNLKINGLTYKIGSEGVSISKFKPYKIRNKLMIDLAIDLKNIRVNADQICMTFNPPNPETGYLDGQNRSNFDCSKIEENQFEMRNNMMALMSGDDSNIVHETVDNDNGTSHYLKDIGVNIRGVDVKVDDNAIQLKFTVAMFMNKDNFLDLNIESASLHKLAQKLTHDELKDKIRLEFRNKRVANIYGLSSMIAQGYPINFSDMDINKALQERRSDLLKLILTPVTKDIGKLVEKVEEDGMTRFQVKLRKEVEISKATNQKVAIDVSSFNFIERDNKHKQLYATLQFDFGDIENHPMYDKSNEVELGHLAVNNIFNLLKQDDNNNSEADFVISLGENLFNDLINFSMEMTRPMLEKEGLEVPFLNFHIEDLGIADEYLSETSRQKLAERTKVGLIHGSVKYTPPKKFLRLLFKVCLFKSCLQLPLVTELYADIIEEDGVPVLVFDLPIIVNDKEFLKHGVEGIEDSNLNKGNFKNLSAKIAAKKIQELFNGFADTPLLKVKLNPFRGINPKQLKFEPDYDAKRLNVLLKFDEGSIRENVVDKVNRNSKIEVLTPKLDLIKDASKKNKKKKE